MPAGAVATKGVLGDACAAGFRERRGMADGGARVPEVLSAAELEGFFAGFVPDWRRDLGGMLMILRTYLHTLLTPKKHRSPHVSKRVSSCIVCYPMATASYS